MITLSVTPVTDATIDLLGKDCDDLQENIVIGDDAISGTLKYVTDYTGFSGDVSEQSGNYIVLKCESNKEDAVIQVTLTNPVTLDEDGIVILRVRDKDTQTITITATSGNQTVTQIYALSELTVLDS